MLALETPEVSVWGWAVLLRWPAGLCGMGVICSALLMLLFSAFLLNSLGMTQLLYSGGAGCWNNLLNIPRLRKGCGHLWQEGPSAASLRGFFGLILQSNLLLSVFITLPFPEPLGRWPSEGAGPLASSCWYL